MTSTQLDGGGEVTGFTFAVMAGVVVGARRHSLWAGVGAAGVAGVAAVIGILWVEGGGIRRTRLVRHQRDSGSAALVIVAMMLPMLLGIGFVWDVSGKLAAGRAADTAAQEAARAAAQQLTATAINGDVADADPGPALEAARAYLAAIGVSGTAAVNADTVTVTASKPWHSQFLPGGSDVTGTATVRIARQQ